MSLPHALLTALVERPSSGSDLAARFDRSIGYFWNASHQQIYRELARLEAEGLIRSLPQQSGRGRKRAYEILPAGRVALTAWMGQGDAAPILRDEMMVRLWAEAAMGPTGLDQVVRERRKQHAGKLAQYERFMARDYPGEPADRATALRRLVLQSGIDYERQWVRLLDEAARILAGP
ncbi:MAG: PadR family transcriptional regulator [Caulobacterales bacterium]|nr:PadR family transcriptional regulator [Caulobacterales bacterium]